MNTCRTVATVLALAVAACTACSAGAPARPSPPASPARPSPSATSPPASASAPKLDGDAATNPACRLLAVPVIERIVGAHVTEQLGVTGPGGYAPTMRSCTWYLDATDVGIPSVNLQWEYPVTQWHDAVVQSYRDVVRQKLGEHVPGVGEYAIRQGYDTQAVDGRNIIVIAVTMHGTPTQQDDAHGAALLRLALAAAGGKS